MSSSALELRGDRYIKVHLTGIANPTNMPVVLGFLAGNGCVDSCIFIRPTVTRPLMVSLHQTCGWLKLPDGAAPNNTYVTTAHSINGSVLTLFSVTCPLRICRPKRQNPEGAIGFDVFKIVNGKPERLYMAQAKIKACSDKHEILEIEIAAVPIACALGNHVGGANIIASSF